MKVKNSRPWAAEASFGQSAPSNRAASNRAEFTCETSSGACAARLGGGAAGRAHGGEREAGGRDALQGGGRGDRVFEMPYVCGRLGRGVS